MRVTKPNPNPNPNPSPNPHQVKKCVSRLLVLVVCLGYGVVRPTLEL